jgi:hypothetical protein
MILKTFEYYIHEGKKDIKKPDETLTQGESYYTVQYSSYHDEVNKGP